VLKQFHIAAQYLATAGKSFLAHQEDDSHTNLGWNSNSLSFSSKEFDGNQLFLNYTDFSLSLKTGEKVELNGLSHAEVVDWLKQVRSDYRFELHYELPYGDISKHVFSLSSKKDSLKLADRRSLTQSVLEKLVSSPIRTWPHHFDSGALIAVAENNSIGLGMSIPDSMVDDFYFYIAGYEGHETVDVSSFGDLSSGKWMKGTWNGATLALTGRSEDEIVAFFREALGSLKERLT